MSKKSQPKVSERELFELSEKVSNVLGFLNKKDLLIDISIYDYLEYLCSNKLERMNELKYRKYINRKQVYSIYKYLCRSVDIKNIHRIYFNYKYKHMYIAKAEAMYKNKSIYFKNDKRIKLFMAIHELAHHYLQQKNIKDINHDINFLKAEKLLFKKLKNFKF